MDAFPYRQLYYLLRSGVVRDGMLGNVLLTIS